MVGRAWHFATRGEPTRGRTNVSLAASQPSRLTSTRSNGTVARSKLRSLGLLQHYHALWSVTQAQLAEKPLSRSGLCSPSPDRACLGTHAGGTTTLARVATRLAISARTLQRRLTSEGVTFDGLDASAASTRGAISTEPKGAISEVAHLPGYSEPSPFHRAFRRLTGKTSN